jgi:hypothetical protein
MKGFLLILSVIIICIVFTNVTQGASAEKSNASIQYEIQGTINGKIVPDVIVLATPGTINGGTISGRISEKVFTCMLNNKDCLSFNKLKLGDKVIVRYMDKKGKLEAFYIKHLP